MGGVFSAAVSVRSTLVGISMFEGLPHLAPSDEKVGCLTASFSLKSKCNIWRQKWSLWPVLTKTYLVRNGIQVAAG